MPQLKDPLEGFVDRIVRTGEAKEVILETLSRLNEDDSVEILRIACEQRNHTFIQDLY